MQVADLKKYRNTHGMWSCCFEAVNIHIDLRISESNFVVLYIYTPALLHTPPRLPGNTSTVIPLQQWQNRQTMNRNGFQHRPVGIRYCSCSHKTMQACSRHHRASVERPPTHRALVPDFGVVNVQMDTAIMHTYTSTVRTSARTEREACCLKHMPPA